MIVYLLCIKRKNWYHPRGRASTQLPSCGDLALNAGGDVNVAAQELTSAQDNVSTVSHVKSTLNADGRS
jgi:hypothetical protein